MDDDLPTRFQEEVALFLASSIAGALMSTRLATKHHVSDEGSPDTTPKTIPNAKSVKDWPPSSSCEIAKSHDALGIQAIAYFFLSLLTHPRNRATEEELNARFGNDAGTLDDGRAKLHKLERRFEGRFPIEKDLSYLDLGCGSGDLSMALAERGVAQVTGIDFIPRNIERARARAAMSGVAERVSFVCRDLREWRQRKHLTSCCPLMSSSILMTPALFSRR